MKTGQPPAMAAAPGGPQLIAYADRFGGNLRALAELVSERLAGAFSGVHILPFYTPFDGADAGFDPVDHMSVDPRLGTWGDIAGLAEHSIVVADLIVNHISSGSAQFSDFRARGGHSPWAAMFLKMADVFPNGATEEDLAKIYRPRPGMPFTAIRIAGDPRLLWTTFTSSQIDLNVTEPVAWSYLSAAVDRMTDAGVSLIRLDAIGYAGKVAGSNCFMTDRTLDFIARLREYCNARGARVLLEVHGHYTQQVEVATHADLVYDFALPPLVLHALFQHDPAPLEGWLAVRPRNVVTVLDTHDGIGVIDAAANDLCPGKRGLLDGSQVAQLVQTIHANGGDATSAATGPTASNLDLYQVNCTFFDALARDERRYLLARALQMFIPGIPQVYYVGLMAGVNDVALFQRTGVGRDLNRHHYSVDEVERGLSTPIVDAQLRLLRLRADHPAFSGECRHHISGTRIELQWRHGDTEAVLDADLAGATFVVRTSSHGSKESVTDKQLLSAGT